MKKAKRHLKVVLILIICTLLCDVGIFAYHLHARKNNKNRQNKAGSSIADQKKYISVYTPR